jgi:hypothetical protein
MAKEYYLQSGQGLGQYETDFYSGSQVQVMIGEVLIDNAVSIQYQVQQSKTPVYGYASQYFRFVADGPVLVTGSLTIAFKEAGYLLYTLKHFQNTGMGGNVRYNSGSGYWYPPEGGLEYASLSAAIRAAKQGRVRYRNIEQVYDTNNNVDRAALVKQLHALSDTEFEKYAEEFEDALWYGSGNQSPNTRAQLFSRNLPASEITDENVLSHRRLDQYPPCDIWITYGDMEAPDGVNHTVHKILDVHFTGDSQVISASGEPVYETYNFFARNRV